jgi:hypothetical protein
MVSTWSPFFAAYVRKTLPILVVFLTLKNDSSPFCVEQESEESGMSERPTGLHSGAVQGGVARFICWRCSHSFTRLDASHGHRAPEKSMEGENCCGSLAQGKRTSSTHLALDSESQEFRFCFLTGGRMPSTGFVGIRHAAASQVVLDSTGKTKGSSSDTKTARRRGGCALRAQGATATCACERQVNASKIGNEAYRPYLGPTSHC